MSTMMIPLENACPRWDLNPYWKDFKSSASAIGLLGRIPCEYSKLMEKKEESAHKEIPERTSSLQLTNMPLIRTF